jgi:hypothetical protein
MPRPGGVPENLKPWPPGESGNPRGRPRALAGFMQLCRQRTPLALQTHEDVMTKSRHPGARVQAAALIIAYAWGRPPQPVALDLRGERMISLAEWRAHVERATEKLHRVFGIDGQQPVTINHGPPADPQSSQFPDALNRLITEPGESTVNENPRILGGDNDRPPVQDTSAPRGPIVIRRPDERPRWPRA